jgi:hypothetical protein
VQVGPGSEDVAANRLIQDTEGFRRRKACFAAASAATDFLEAIPSPSSSPSTKARDHDLGSASSLQEGTHLSPGISRPKHWTGR